MTTKTPQPVVARAEAKIAARPAVEHGELISRLLAHWLIKSTVTPLLMAAFFVGYFLVLKNPLFPVAVVPLTAVDRWIPFWPGALPLYFSLWIYVPLVPALLRERSELFTYGRAAVALALAGLGIFLVCPTAVQLTDIDWESHRAFAFLKTVDAAGNACPSLHVAFAVFSALWFQHVFQAMGDRGIFRMLNWAWCAGIIYSTLATKQHVFLDVVAGAALGLLAGILGQREVRRRPK
jgi:membrane-associated phospholipid phosphatase